MVSTLLLPSIDIDSTQECRAIQAILRDLYHYYWWSDATSQSTSRHGTGLLYPKYPGLPSEDKMVKQLVSINDLY